MLERIKYNKIMNRLSQEKQKQVIASLVEGNSIRATVRMTGVAKNTIVKLLADVGKACAEYQDKVFHDLTCNRIQCDEIWSFCYAKEKNVSEEFKGKFGYGDIYTWIAICADSKLVPSWFVGRRDYQSAKYFIDDLAGRLAHRVQLTTDGRKAYLQAIEDSFGSEIDYAQIIKLYGNEVESEKRYSPAQCTGAIKERIQGNPDIKHVSTSYVERQNLTMRMSMRRFTRLTNGFSKKVENHAHAISLHYMYYNFCRIHQTLRVTPAMEAGVTDHVWEIEEILSLLNMVNS
jgi:IS1 family transposase